MHRRLPLRKILWGGFALSWLHRREVARATGMPLLVVIACTLLQNVAGFSANGSVTWALYFVYCIALAWLAISVHRVVLIDGDSATRLDATGLRRLGRFVGTMIGAWLLFAALTVVLISAALIPFTTLSPSGAPMTRPLPVAMSWIELAAKILALWPVARVSLLFPALALEQRFDPIAAWRAASGNGWKLAIVIGALPWLLRQFAEALYRDEATMVEFGLLLVVTSLFTIIQVTALSLAYWELTRPELPTTPPPA